MEVDKWERRVGLLESLAAQPKRWWLNPRSDPSQVQVEMSQMKKINNKQQQQQQPNKVFTSSESSSFVPISGNSNGGSSDGSGSKGRRRNTNNKRKRTSGAASASSPTVDTIRQHKRNKLRYIEHGLLL